MASKRAKAAARAAKRIPLVGTAVVVAPVLRAASNAGLSLGNMTNVVVWRAFLSNLKDEFTDPGALAATYTPIATYLIVRRFAGKHISRVLRPLGVKF